MTEYRVARIAAMGAFLTIAFQAGADTVPPAEGLAQAWDHVQFELTDKDQRLKGFANIADEADRMIQDDPGNAEAMVWEAICLSSVAGEIRGPSALGKVNKARDLLLSAESINPDTLGDGSIYSSLGSLYYQVPSFPIGFGNKKKAREYLSKALAQNPEGIDPNYFMADLMVHTGDYKAALKYVSAAEAAPLRPGREIADAGRRKELMALRGKIESKLGK